jgi:hypothetical protein
MALTGNTPSAFHVAFTNTTAEQEAVVRYKGETETNCAGHFPGSF